MITRAIVCLVVALAVTCQAEPIRRRFDETAVDEKMEVIQSEVDTLKAMLSKRMQGQSIRLQDAKDARDVESSERTSEEENGDDRPSTTTSTGSPSPTTPPPPTTTAAPTSAPTTTPRDPNQRPKSPVFTNVGNKRYFLKYKVNGKEEKDLIMLDDVGGSETNVVKKGDDTEMIHYDYIKGTMLVILPSKRVCNLHPIPADMMTISPKKLKASLARLVKVSRDDTLAIEDEEDVEFRPSSTRNVTSEDLGPRGVKLCKGFQRQWMEPEDDNDKDQEVSRQQRWDPELSLDDRSVYTADVESENAEEQWEDARSLEDRSLYTSDIDSEPYIDNAALEDGEVIGERSMDGSNAEDYKEEFIDEPEPSLEDRSLSIEHFLDEEHLEERSQQNIENKQEEEAEEEDWKPVEDELEETNVQDRDFSDFSLEDAEMEERDFSVEEREQAPGYDEPELNEDMAYDDTNFDERSYKDAEMEARDFSIEERKQAPGYVEPELNEDMAFDDTNFDERSYEDDLAERGYSEGDLEPGETNADNPDDDTFFNERFFEDDPEFQERSITSDNDQNLDEYQSEFLDDNDDLDDFEEREFNDDSEIIYGQVPDEVERELVDENVDEDVLRKALDDEDAEDGNEDDALDTDEEPNERELSEYSVDGGDFGDFDDIDDHEVMKRSINSTNGRKIYRVRYYKRVCKTSKRWTCHRKRLCAPRYMQYCCNVNWRLGCMKTCYYRIPSLCVSRFTCEYPERCWKQPAYYRTYKRPSKKTGKKVSYKGRYRGGKPKKTRYGKKPLQSKKKPITKVNANKIQKLKKPLPKKKPALAKKKKVPTATLR